MYRECHDWGEMARLIEAHAAALLGQGRGETIARWVEELPAEVQAKRPWTIYWAASSQAQLAPREGRILYERAFELFRAQADSVGTVLAASGAMFAILYELDDCSLLDRWIAVLDQAEKDGPLPLTREAEARVACSMLFSLTLRQPQRRDIKRWIERALAASAGQPDVNLRMFVGLLASLTLMWTGLFSRAAELIAAMRQAAAASGVSPFSLITLKNIETMHAMLTADGAACEKAMREGLEIAHATGVHTWTFQLLVYGYGGALGAGNLAQAQAIARELAARTATAGRFNLCLYHHFQAWEAMLRKDLMTALQEEKAALRTAIEVGCPLFEVLCRLALAEILAECGDERKCIAHLQTLRGIVEDIDNRHLEFTCLVGFAQIALAHGRQRTGLTALRRGLQLGREYGYVHFLWWRPAAVARVLADALAAGIEPDYARSLIKRRALVPEQPPLAVEGWPWTYRVQTFGGFRLLRHDRTPGCRQWRQGQETAARAAEAADRLRRRAGEREQGDRRALAAHRRRLGAPLVHQHAAPVAQAPRRGPRGDPARRTPFARPALLLARHLGFRAAGNGPGIDQRRAIGKAGREAACALPRQLHGRRRRRRVDDPGPRAPARALRPRPDAGLPSLAGARRGGARRLSLREMP